ncbi:MAG: dephospho-CoA kinase [bacterium]|nr:dephospho-CoA kinase [bacterium]
MMVIGITGGIGSGKSTVSGMFRELGARVIDADKVAQEVMAPFEPGWWAVYEYFGQGIVCPETSEIDRARLGSLVFGDPLFLRKLNSLVHPLILRRIEELLQQLRDQGTKVAVLDAPLLIETGLHRRVDVVVVVWVERDIQIARLKSRQPQMAMSEIVQRINSQMSLEEKKKYADFVIDNNQSLEKTRQQVELIFQTIVKKGRGFERIE